MTHLLQKNHAAQAQGVSKVLKKLVFLNMSEKQQTCNIRVLIRDFPC